MAIKFDFGAIKETVSGLAQAGAAMGKKAAAVAKLKSDNLAQQDALRKTYLAIGKQFYAEHKDDVPEAYAELFAKADAALSAIAANNAALEEMKEREEVVIDVEMTAGDMPEDFADFADTDVQPVVEDAPVEDAPVEDVPTDDTPAE